LTFLIGHSSAGDEKAWAVWGIPTADGGCLLGRGLG
jgi:hypothetical protein